MKKLNPLSKLALVSLIAVPALAWAETDLASSPLWQAPTLSSFSVSAADGSDELKASCTAFEDLNSKYEGMPLTYRKRMFEEERRTALQSQFPATVFSTEIKTDLMGDGVFLGSGDRSLLANVASELARTEDRVHFTQVAETVFVDTTSIVMVDVQSKPGSLTELATKLGVARSIAKFERKGMGVVLVISGKDLACDIIRGRATILASGKGFVRLGIDAQTRLKMFYSRFSDTVAAVLDKYSRPKQRAAMLGYRLSALFASVPGVTEDRAEKAMLDALDTYFDAPLDTNALWTQQSGRKILSLRGISDPFNVTVTVSH